MRRSWRWVLLVAVGLAALALGACSSKGIVRSPAPLTDIAHPQVQPREVWSTRIGNGSGGLFSGLRVVVRKDGVFVGAENGDAAAFDPKTGKRIWRTDTDARLIAGPTVSGKQVLFGTLDAKVIALDRATGKRLWTGEASSEVLAPPASDGRIVVVRSIDGRVYGLSANNGKRVWSFVRTEPRLTLRGQSAPLIIGSNVLIGQDNGTLVSLDIATGKAQWQQAISIPTGRSELERLVDIDAGLLEGLHGVYVDSYGGTIALVDPLSGNIRWKRHVKSWTGMALSADGSMLYVTDDDSDVWALDAVSGAEAWKQDALHFRTASSPAVQGDDVVVGDFAGYLHWLSPGEGHIVGRTRMSHDPIVTAPVVFNGVLYAMDVDGHLAAYATAEPPSDD